MPAPAARPASPVAHRILLLIVGAAAIARAQTAPPPAASAAELADLPLEQLMELPVESVSGVSKYEQSIRRAPAGVTVFTAADIRNYGWRTLADALRAASGFHIRHDRFYDYVGNRGFTRPFDYNSRTLVLVNGHRMNDSIYQQGSVGTEFILDLELVDRIEIIRGPGSSIYGSNAFYGAVNVIPKRGRDLAGPQTSLSVGTEPSLKGRVTAGDRSSGGIEYLVSATALDSRGESDFDLPDAWRAIDPSYTARTARDRDDLSVGQAYAHVSWRGIQTEAAYVRRDKDVLPAVYGTTNDTPAFGIDERAYALVRLEGKPTPDSTLGATAAIDHYHYEGLFTPRQDGGIFHQLRPYADSLSLNGSIRWQVTLEEKHTLAVGLETQMNLRQDIGRDNLTLNIDEVPVREKSSYFSPYAQLDYEFTPTLRASLGGRYDHYDFDQQRFTPRLGLIWDAGTSTTLKFLYGESFRVPNVNERFAAELNFTPNPALGPEINRTWEIVAEHRLNPVWSLESHGYYIESSDLITVIDQAGSFVYANAQDYRTEGFSLGAAAYYPSGLQLRASGTLQRSYDDATGSTVFDAPRQLLKLATSAPLGRRWLRGSAELQYVGDRKDVSGRSTGDYATVNLTVRASQLWHRWDLSLSVYNLAGDRWSEPKDFDQIESVPRTAVLRATLDF
jgi:outer membrane receptor protein involved in Fe transport